MTTRRQVLHVAASMASLTVGAVPAQELSDSGRTVPQLRFDSVMVEPNVPEAAHFAMAAGALGTPVEAVEGDVGTFLYRRLAVERFRLRPVLLGLTSGMTLFCVERLAWDLDLRLQYRGEHRLDPDGRGRHQLVGLRNRPGSAQALYRAGAQWPARLAGLLHSISADALSSAAGAALGRHVLASTPRTLYSWILVPLRDASALRRQASRFPSI